MVKLGDKVRDKITGFTGIATGKFEYLAGCLRISVERMELDSTGKTSDATFDEDRLEVVEAGAIVLKQVEPRTGGPAPTPMRETPRR